MTTHYSIEQIDGYLEHYYFCQVVQRARGWDYVDCIRHYFTPTGISSEFENMLDVEFVALHYGLLPENLYTNPEAVYSIFELYQAWVNAIKKETYTQWLPMTNTNFSRQ